MHPPQVFVHDPTALMAVIRPDLFDWISGPIRVATDGVFRGATVMETTAERVKWYGANAWTGRPGIHVAVGVDS